MAKLLDYGWLPLKKIYSELGISETVKDYQDKYKFKYDLDKVLQMLVFSRVLDPKSKSKTVKNQEYLFGNWNISQNDMDRGLDHLFNLVSDIQIATHRSIMKNYGRVGTLVFYDVTNFFFHIDENDEYEIDTNGVAASDDFSQIVKRPGSMWDKRNVKASKIWSLGQ
ncbi:hypothetical protein FACS1894125_3420 [Actinomycetota bacterium]|nr:hypothetical protein FACS1894125_3420 [Actinomycetota bacterium]